MNDYVEKLKIDQNAAMRSIIATLESAASQNVVLALLLPAVKGIFGAGETSELKDEIARIWIAIDGLKSGNFGNDLFALETPGLDRIPKFRRAKESLFILRHLNTRSTYGYYWDPRLKYEDGISLFREFGSLDPEKSLRLVIHELSEKGLIYVSNDGNAVSGIHSIGPQKYFFAITDPLFQPWDLKEDAKVVIRESLAGESNAASHQKIIQKFGWSVRRMNAVVLFMEMNGLIQEIESAIRNNLWGDYVRLTPEAEFFLEDED